MNIERELRRLIRKCKCSSIGVVTIEGVDPDLTQTNKFQILDDRTVFVACDETVVELGGTAEGGGFFTSSVATANTIQDSDTFDFTWNDVTNLLVNALSTITLSAAGVGTNSKLELELENGTLTATNGADTSIVRVAPGVGVTDGVQIADTQGLYRFYNGAPFLPVEDTPDKTLGVKNDGQIVTFDAVSGGFFTSSTGTGDVVQNAGNNNFTLEGVSNFETSASANARIEATSITGNVTLATTNVTIFAQNNFDAIDSFAYIQARDGSVDCSITVNPVRITLASDGSRYRISPLPPTYADDAAAGAGGLIQGELYKTAAGQLMIKL